MSGARPDAALDEHHATVVEALADAIPDAVALAQGDRERTFAEMDQRAARLSAALTDAGLGVQARVAIDLFNCLEWLEAFHGVLKGRHVPVSINYRYLDDELAYLFDNADAEAVIYHASLADRVLRVARRKPGMKLIVQVDDVGGAPVPDGVVDYAHLVAHHRPAPRISRPPDDVIMSYSGGTTGLPKGVLLPVGPKARAGMGRDARLRTLGRFDDPGEGYPEDLVAAARASWRAGATPVAVPAAPLMHSTAMSYAGPSVLFCGGTVVTLDGHGFDAHELFRTIERRKVTTIAIVGDAFAVPMVRALEERAAAGDPYDAMSVRAVYSAGVQWSAAVKAGLFSFLPEVTLLDNCGSSEGAWYGSSTLRRGDPPSTATFRLAPGVLVLDGDGRPMAAGAAEPGLLASPTNNLGYHKDPEKTAANFRMIDGRWYTVPGDLGMIRSDGMVVLVGRGSSVINTGGEKVFPEEVDEVVKTMAGVDDCLVVGIPDDRFGQIVAAVVQVRPGEVVSPEAVREHVRARLAAYKAPRVVVSVPSVPRFPNGKPDYETTRTLAAASLR